MKDINVLSASSCTLEDLKEQYESLTKKISILEQQKKVYDDMLKDDGLTEEELSFKDKIQLYTVIENLIYEQKYAGESLKYRGIDLEHLLRRIMLSSADLMKYYELIEQISNLEKERSNILFEDISFAFFGEDMQNNEKCLQNRHYLVRLDNELVCMNCGETTKNYSENEKYVDFLTLAAESHGCLIKETKQNDLPLVRVLIEEKEEARNKRIPLDEVPENEYVDYSENYSLIDEAEILAISREIQKAHKFDSRELDGLPKVNDPKYFSDEKAQQLLSEIDEQISKAEKSNSRFKDLILEECKTAKYEVLILSGAHIPTLLQGISNEEDKYALTKAYYNLSNCDFRINSGYFKPDDKAKEAIFYHCRTANPEINQKILNMKRRKK